VIRFLVRKYEAFFSVANLPIHHSNATLSAYLSNDTLRHIYPVME